MYIGYVNSTTAQTWIYAFYAGLQFFEAQPRSLFGVELRDKVKKQRGWKVAVNCSVPHQMRQKGADEKIIVEELFVIEIEVCRRMAQEIAAQEPE